MMHLFSQEFGANKLSFIEKMRAIAAPARSCLPDWHGTRPEFDFPPAAPLIHPRKDSARTSSHRRGAAPGGPGEVQNLTRSGGPSLKNRETIS
jgi:hypothetical protein